MMSKPQAKKELLGQGIRSLLKGIDAELKTPEGSLKTELVEKTTGINKIPIGQIEVNPKQPRQDFNETALKELADSIRIHDIIQPLTVSRIGPNKYRLIAGERRLRASKLAGLKEVPVYIREVNDQQLLELALLENLKREDLNAIEIGLSYQRLMEECELTQEKVAERMGVDRSAVSNHIRLLKLPPSIVAAVRDGSISYGHARSIITVDTVEKQLYLFKEIVEKGLSVRQTESLVKTLKPRDAGKKKTARPGNAPYYQKIEDELASHFGTRVKLLHQKKGNGQIILEYHSVEALTALLDKMKVSVQ